MSLVVVATLSSVLSFITGIITVGGGSHFQYSKMDILRGRRDALLYIWVTFSSIFALGHCAKLIDYGLRYNWSYRTPDAVTWMVIHTGVGLLLTTAHIFVRTDLNKGVSNITYLWGSRRAG